MYLPRNGCLFEIILIVVMRRRRVFWLSRSLDLRREQESLPQLQIVQEYTLGRPRLNLGPGVRLLAASPFPFLDEKDTFLKPTVEKRALGDSRRIDGSLWHIAPSLSRSSVPESMVESEDELEGIY